MPAISTALIVGGGLAGLTAATALARRGVTVDVLELRAEPAGAAITIQNRAIHALADLGLLDGVVEAGLPHTQQEIFRYFDAAGDAIATPPMPAATDTGLPSAVVIHRVPLSHVLREGALAAGATIRDGLSITALDQHEDSVTATLTDGTTGDYDLVVGADGVRSTVRRLVLGDEVVPKYTGTTMFRWVVPGIPADVGDPGFYQAAGVLNVTLRLRDGSLYLATGRTYATKPGRLSPEQARQVVAENLAPFTAPLVVAMREKLSEDADIVVNHYDWLLTPDPWYRGRVVVIGDAAHATTAYLASGGGMAIEDGAVLGEEVAADATPADFLARFVERRFERARLVVETSVELGRMFDRGAPIPEQNAVRGRALGALRAPY